MMRCSPEAFAKCPTRALCGNVQEATFTEGSECDRFNRSVLDQPMTNADKIRMMVNESLAGFIKKLFRMVDTTDLYCPFKKECQELVDTDSVIPERWCDRCLLEWLQSPAGKW